MPRNMSALAAGSILVVGAFLFFELSQYSSRTGSGSPVYSTRRHDPFGTAALYLLLSESGRPVRVLNRSLLPPGKETILIQCLTERDSAIDSRELLAWVAEGNTLVQLTRYQTTLVAEAQLTTDDENYFYRDEWGDSVAIDELEKLESQGVRSTMDAVSVPIVDPRWSSIEPLELVAPISFQIDEDDVWKPLATLGDDVVACSRKHGLGEIIVVGTPSLASNQTLGKGGNLDFLLRVIGSKTTILDDWSHGLGRSETFMGVIRDFGLLPVVLQLLLLVALYAWSGRGDSPYVERASRGARSSAEQIQTLGYLYQESFSLTTTLEMVTSEVRRRLARVLKTTPGDLELAIRMNRSKHASQADMILRNLNEAGIGSADHIESRLMELLTSSQQLLAEVDVERRFRS